MLADTPTTARRFSLRAAKGKRRDYAYYRCCGTDAYRFDGQRVCSNDQVRTDRLDEAVWREVERLLHDPARAAAEVQLAKLRRGMGRLIDSYAEGLIERSEFEPRIAGFRQRIQGWEAQLKAMRDEAALRSTLSLVIGRLEDFAKRVRDRMCEVDWFMQRDLIRNLVTQVEINQDDINVVFRVDGTFSTPDPTSPGQNSFWQDYGRVNDPALWRFLVPFLQRPVRQLHRRSQPPLDVGPYPLAIGVLSYRLHQKFMVDIDTAGKFLSGSLRHQRAELRAPCRC